MVFEILDGVKTERLFFSMPVEKASCSITPTRAQ